MSQSLPLPDGFVDPFGDGPAEQDYPPVLRLQQLVGPRRAPYCDCPRAVLLDGRIRVWHQPWCGELREQLDAIL